MKSRVARGTAGHPYLQAGGLLCPPGFKLFLQLHLGFVHEQLQVLNLHLQGLQVREHCFIPTVESGKSLKVTGGEGLSMAGTVPQKPDSAALVTGTGCYGCPLRPEYGARVSVHHREAESGVFVQ